MDVLTYILTMANEAQKRWRKAHPEAWSALRKTHYQKHKLVLRDKARKRRARRLEDVLKYGEKYRDTHRNAHREYMRDYHSHDKAACLWTPCTNRCKRTAVLCRKCDFFIRWLYGYSNKRQPTRLQLKRCLDTITLQDMERFQCLKTKRQEQALRKRLTKTLQLQIFERQAAHSRY